MRTGVSASSAGRAGAQVGVSGSPTSLLQAGGLEPPERPPTRKGGPQSHKDQSGDTVPEAHGAAEMRGQVPNDSSQEADAHHRNDKAGPAVPVLSGRNTSKQKLPKEAQEVQGVVQAARSPLHLFLAIALTWWEQTLEK